VIPLKLWSLVAELKFPVLVFFWIVPHSPVFTAPPKPRWKLFM
jgi:hypothetical protein